MATSRDRDLDQIRAWTTVAARAADDKKGEDIVVLEVGGVLAITEAFVITSASNVRQVKTIAEEVEERLRDEGLLPMRIEGRSDARWILMDYGDFVVHVFLSEVRDYYDLERLWSDAPRIDWAPAAAASGE